jgi:hypothetical protein
VTTLSVAHVCGFPQHRPVEPVGLGACPNEIPRADQDVAIVIDTCAMK